MKRAMWNVAPFGDFAFRGGQGAQLILGIAPDHTPLREALEKEFKSKGWVTIEQVLEFVASDRTYFHTGQVKRPVLLPMERAKLIEVDPKTRRTHGYPKGTHLRFL